MSHEVDPSGTQLGGDGTSSEDKRTRAEIVRTSGRALKLAAAWLLLAVATVASAIALARLTSVQTPTVAATVTGVTLTFNRLWLLAALAGLLGGSVRGVFMLIAENYAFEYWDRTGKHSEWAIKILGERCGFTTIDDDFDPLTNWWAYPLKPIMGMGFGFLFGLLQLLGLIPFLQRIDADPPDMSVAVVAALAGLLTEEAVSKLQELFDGGGAAKRMQRTRQAQAPEPRR